METEKRMSWKKKRMGWLEEKDFLEEEKHWAGKKPKEVNKKITNRQSKNIRNEKFVNYH